MLRWIAAVLIGLGLTGCGQKGDLYLPPLSEPAHAEQPNAQQSSAGQPQAERSSPDPANPAHP